MVPKGRQVPLEPRNDQGTPHTKFGSSSFNGKEIRSMKSEMGEQNKKNKKHE